MGVPVSISAILFAQGSKLKYTSLSNCPLHSTLIIAMQHIYDPTHDT